MPNPFAGQAKSSSASKYKSMLGKSSKGQTYDGQSQSKYVSAGNVAGGSEERVGGDRSKARADKYARGGPVRGRGTKVNINIFKPPGENQALPPPLTPAALGPAAAMAPPGPSPVPGPMPGGGAPMPPPMMRKDGGRATKHDDEAQDRKLISKMMAAKKADGGRVKMTGGAEGGVGRMQKAKNAAKVARIMPGG